MPLKPSSLKKLHIAITVLISLVFLEMAILFLPRKEAAISEIDTAASPKFPFPAEILDAVKERERWSARIEQVGAKQAYEEFKSIYTLKHFTIQHTAAHIFGTLLYEHEGVPGLAICDNTFAFGCYHSFFGRAIIAEGPEVVAKLDTICLEKFGEYGTGCQHGIGHGTMEYAGHDNLALALELCSATTEKNPLFGCATGTFMEYTTPLKIDSTSTSITLRRLNPDNPYEPCPAVIERYRKPCYYGLGQWWDKIFDKNYAKIGELCGRITEETYREPCFLGIGNVVAPSSEYDVALTIEQCKKMPDAQTEIICRSGASWSFFADPRRRPLALAVCEGLNPESQSTCVQKSDLLGTRTSR